MPLPNHSSSSFTGGFGSSFPQSDVVIVHKEATPEERRISARAMIQSSAGYFDVATQIYEGDIVELDDPRGGTRRLYVKVIDINDGAGSRSFAHLSHIKATWGKAPSTRSNSLPKSSTIYNGPVINVHGKQAQIAWNNKSVSQQNQNTQTIAPGYEAIAAAVTTIYRQIQESDVAEDDREILIEAAEEVLEEVTRETPNNKIIRRSLASLQGMLNGILSSAVSGAGTAAEDWTHAAVKSLLTLGIPTN